MNEETKNYYEKEIKRNEELVKSWIRCDHPQTYEAKQILRRLREEYQKALQREK